MAESTNGHCEVLIVAAEASSALYARRLLELAARAAASPQRIAEELARYIDDESYFKRTESELMKTRDRLGMGVATRRVAGILEAYLK